MVQAHQQADIEQSAARLRVVDVTADGAALVCDDPSAGAISGHYVIPLDESFYDALRRAGVSVGQPDAADREQSGGSAPDDGHAREAVMSVQLRPKEIQDRIRAGASVEQVAAAAGCPVERIEGFAYPVLLERSTIAEKARAARPLHGAQLGSAAAADAHRTLESLVTQTLTDRGQLRDVVWDAFKDERGWMVTVTWQAGRTENRAEWSFTSQPAGNSVTPRNDAARDLVEPSRAPLRSVGDDAHSGGPHASTPLSSTTPRSARSQNPDAPISITRAQRGLFDAADEAETASDVGTPVRADRPRHSASGEQQTSREAQGQSGVPDQDATAGSDAAAGPPKRKKGQRAPMPSWEDVLLGTRPSQ